MERILTERVRYQFSVYFCLNRGQVLAFKSRSYPTVTLKIEYKLQLFSQPYILCLLTFKLNFILTHAKSFKRPLNASESIGKTKPLLALRSFFSIWKVVAPRSRFHCALAKRL